jgi:uncharacterized cupin superfamily protein
MSNLQQFKNDLKHCAKVFGYVKYSNDDGTEIELKKTDVSFVFKDYPSDTRIDYRIDPVHKYLYLG